MNEGIRKKLGEASFSIRGIAMGSAILVLCGAFIAGLISFFTHDRAPLPKAEQELISSIYTRFLLQEAGGVWNVSQLEGPVPEGLDALFIGPEELWHPVLVAKSSLPDPDQGVRFALGLWKRTNQQLREALQLFHEENSSYPSSLVRALELDTALLLGDGTLLNDLASDPEYQDEVDSMFQFRWGLRSGDWKKMLRHFPASQYSALERAPLLLAVLAGGIWSLLLLTFYPGRPPVRFLLTALLALVLGAVSTWPTVLSGMWMESALGISGGTDFFSTLFAMIVSVGFREEVLKLLLFSPLLIITHRRGSDLEALLLGAFVGLGFAMEENITYVSGNLSGVAVSRFVSANMLHFMLTGATALALSRAVRDPKAWGLDALQVLVFAIGLHGIYNTLLSQPVPGLGDMSYFHGAALVGCAALFFPEMERLIPSGGRTFSRTGLFCWGLCLLFGLELILAVQYVPFRQALYLTGQAALASVFTGYIFIHAIREPLHS